MFVFRRERAFRVSDEPLPGEGRVEGELLDDRIVRRKRKVSDLSDDRAEKETSRSGKLNYLKDTCFLGNDLLLSEFI